MDKELAILKFLSSQESWVTSFSMSVFLDISVRTIKSYISNINSKYPGLIESSRKGYIVRDKKRLEQLINFIKTSHSPQTVEDRKKYILRKLLLETNSYDLDALANELLVSPLTLANELSSLKRELADFELKIKTKNNKAFIDGHEANKKKLISKLIYEDTKDSFLSIKIMQNYLPHFDLTKIKQIVSEALRKHQYFMDEFSLLNLVLHIAITMERKLMQETCEDETSPESGKSMVNSHIQEIAVSIVEQVEKEFRVKFVECETYDFALYIMTRAISSTINDINIDQLGNFVGENIVRLVSLIQTRVKETYNITLIRKDFTIRFALHIKNLLIRLKNRISLRNPQMLEIKNSYPFIYDVSVFIANIITQEEGYELTEDEISYIALHLGVLIEEKKVIKHEVRAILVNPQYLYKSEDIAVKLSSIFSNNLLITEIVSGQHELETYYDYDMIITTIPFEIHPGKPYVQISPYIANKDILNVSKKIEEVLSDRIKTKMKLKLEMMFKRELFFVGADFKDQNDAINVMADALEKQGIVDSSFKQKLFERERISSSAYMNIAMPHPLEMCAINSAIAVSIHPDAIQWNDNKVNIIFMLAINIRDRLFLKDIFDFITEVISEESKLKTLLEVKTYDQFIETLISFVK